MSIVSKIVSHLFGRGKSSDASSSPEGTPPHAKKEYTNLIAQYIPYFHLLTPSEKELFIQRTWLFRNNKSFHFVNMAAFDGVPVLISAAAVQMTFGLRDYRLGFFKDIYVMPDAYQYDLQSPPYIGHVSPQGIFISWKHFLQGYADSGDNVNVAIHEMAHALSYNNFVAVADTDWEFRDDFAKLPGLYGPEMNKLIVNKRSYLRPYAFTNPQEFWAVSVEAFFENPVGLKDNMPGLYAVIAEILNQDLQARHRINTTV